MPFAPLIARFKKAYDNAFVLDCIRRIVETDRWFSSDTMRQTCRTVEAIMREIGLAEVKTLRFPSDGRIAHGGWVMPLCWDAREATLEIVAPAVADPLLCRYTDTPCSLMLNSRPGDVSAPVVWIDGHPRAPVRGRFVLVTNQWPGLEKTMAWFEQGAVGVLSSCLGGNYWKQPEHAYLRDSCQWLNYAIPHWPVRYRPMGFSLTPNQGLRLRELLKRHPRLTLRARVDTRLYPGTLPMVTGLLPGTTREELAVTGHLFEQGADDNASGVALALGVARALRGRRLKRGIRFLFTYEVRSLQAWLNGRRRIPAPVAGINLDMVGAGADKRVCIGNTLPVLPSYAVPLLRDILRRFPGYTSYESPFGAIDNALADPLVGTPIPAVLLWDYPYYHKAGDTPERLDPAVLQTLAETVGCYLSLLAQAGPREAQLLAGRVYEAERERLRAVERARAFHLDLSRQALASVLRLARTPALERGVAAWSRKLEREFQPLPDPASPEPTPADRRAAGALGRIVPRKTFRGFFSFEKNLARGSWPRSLDGVVRSWSAPGWVNHLLMWSNGRRTAWEICARLQAWCAPPPSAALVLETVRFLRREGYLSMKPRRARPGRDIA